MRLLEIYGAFVFVGLVTSLSIYSRKTEYGSYVNPNPRSRNKCDAEELIQLTDCSNEVLTKLSICKADDLPCECCALQSIKHLCYNLCPGNPSANILSVLIEECATLSEVNACALPFKKSDPKISRIKATDMSQDDSLKTVVKSRLSNFKEEYLLNEETGNKINILLEYDKEIDKPLVEDVTQNMTSSANLSNFDDDNNKTEEIANETNISALCKYIKNCNEGKILISGSSNNANGGFFFNPGLMSFFGILGLILT